MLQCLMCEDWFHIAHISRQEPQDLIDEFACEACVARHPFLRKFPSIVHSVLVIMHYGGFFFKKIFIFNFFNFM